MLTLLIKKHSLITTALVASLSLTACGSKKDTTPSGGPKPETSGEKTPAESSSDTNGKLGGSLGEGESEEAQSSKKPHDQNNELPPLPAPPPEEETKPVAPGKPSKPSKPDSKPESKPEVVKPSKPSKPSTKPSAPSVSESGGGNSCQGPSPSVLAASDSEEAIPEDYISSDVRNLENDSLSKRFTGGIYGDGLYYTSSSTDDLLSFLRARNQRASYENRKANVAAASSVQFAQLSVESMSNDAIVTLKIKESGKVKIYNLAGGIEEGYSTRLRAVHSGNGTVSTGTRPIEATAKCLDLDGGCETTLVRVVIGEQGCSGVFYVVFRKSISDLYFNFAKKSGESDNMEFLRLRDFFINTILNKKHLDNKIETATMSSWEVVNGKSGVTVAMKGLNNELVAFGAPLVAPEAGTSVNLPASRVANDADDSLDLLALNKYSLNYANTIGDARLIANNGLGQVRIMIKMRKRSNYPQDKVAITFMRRIKPLVEINDDNLK